MKNNYPVADLEWNLTFESYRAQWAWMFENYSFYYFVVSLAFLDMINLFSARVLICFDFTRLFLLSSFENGLPSILTKNINRKLHLDSKTWDFLKLIDFVVFGIHLISNTGDLFLILLIFMWWAADRLRFVLWESISLSKSLSIFSITKY